MQLVSKLNKGFRFSLCVIENFSKYAQIVPLKDKIGLDQSRRKPNKIWVDKGNEFYNNLF